jgi:hypothetical protein
MQARRAVQLSLQVIIRDHGAMPKLVFQSQLVEIVRDNGDGRARLALSRRRSRSRDRP